MSFIKQYQPDNSYKCGLYTLSFIHSISQVGIEQTILQVCDNLNQRYKYQNDRYVTRYYFRHLTSTNCKQWKINDGKRAITYKECK